MRIISQILLNFLINASWQLALIAAVASVCAWLVRGAVPRHRHLLWVAALVMSVGLPWLTGSQLASRAAFFSTPATITVGPPTIQTYPTDLTNKTFEPRTSSVPQNSWRSLFQVSEKWAVAIALLYFSLLVYRGLKFGRAWQRTKAIKDTADPLEFTEEIQAIVGRCQTAIGAANFKLRSSASVSVPITVGIRNPLIIMPEQLLREADLNVLTSAIGHELVHVLRRDYLLNLIYELIYLPLSFHPAAALVRRRINQTRELSCDELVTEKLLGAEIYAHSLVQLAGSAVPFGRHANLTVGITDADILEVRIMSLLRKSKLDGRRAKPLLVAASVLLATPCVAAAAFGLSFEIAPQEPTVGQAKESTRAKPNDRAEPEYAEDARANKIEGTVGLIASIGTNGVVQYVLVTKPLYPSLDQNAVEAMKKWRFEPLVRDGQAASQKIGVEMVFNLNSWQQDARERKREREEELKRAEQESQLTQEQKEERSRREQEEREMKERAERDPQFRAELEAREHHRQEERKAMLIAHAILARTAKITMEQAIQIANSQYPGKVMECSLVGQHWESPGKLAKDGHVLYHVVIISTDNAEPTLTYVLVNAVDGTSFKT